MTPASLGDRLRPGRRGLRAALAAVVLAATVAALMLFLAQGAHAAVPQSSGPQAAQLQAALPLAPGDPVDPTAPADPTEPGTGSVDISINGINGTPSTAIVTLLGITALSVAPALLLMMTSFTKIFIVLAMARNALGLPSVPPNQVLAGLALFLSLFIMAPTIADINTHAVQPYLNGSIDVGGAFSAAADPLRHFMLPQTREEDIALMTRAANRPNPETPDSVPMLTLIPSFMISELRSAFIIGFVVFIPFLIIDIVVSSALMSMGMMMLPPVMISLPFKILLFILVDGWGLIVTALIRSYGGSG